MTNILTFTPTSFQEVFMEEIARANKICLSPYRAGKRRAYDEITCKRLTEMKVGQKFVLITPLGSYIFRLEAHNEP